MSGDPSIRPEKIAIARARLAAGYYETPGAISRTVDQMLVEFDRCPVGEGDPYRDLAANLIAGNLPDIADVQDLDFESRVTGGRVDAILPLRLESLPGSGLWGCWQREYKIDSILVESKNYSKCVGNSAVDQTLRYIMITKRGNFAFLVSRSGFSTGARRTVSDLARHCNILILPFSHNELKSWCDSSLSQIEKDRILRVKRNDIYRMAG
ncbi:MAG TPA: hypothetical protein P5081_18695 [Phycisphaerae bacterium]|nr:hypothetical protein [Phycisphaerae bacterium]HRW54902.1 hypothetical protein [Phycisphaerae bacterium]